MMRRRLHSRSHDETLDSAGRVRIPSHLIEHAGLDEGPCVVIGVADHLEIWAPEAWATHDAEIDATAAEIAEELAGGGRLRERVRRRDGHTDLHGHRTRSGPRLGADRRPRPPPGRDRGRLHLRRRRPRPAGRRAPRGRWDAGLRRSRPGRRGARSTSSPRKPSASFGSCGRTSPTRSRGCAPKAFAPSSSTWTSASPRCSSRRPSGASRTPTTRRSTCAWTPSRRCPPPTVVNEWPEDRIAGVIRDYGEERHARAIAARDRPSPAARDDRRAGRGGSGGGPARLPLRRAAIRPSGPSRRSGSRSTTSSACSTGGCRPPGSCFRWAGAWPRSRSTRSRIAG